ncbi:hypothetical protein ACH3VR_11310 [Microbacterium sp. B2969]|uniref:Uncharacterized protein n=1 Tax=Microbacterium alkaliflavum TaxID=3248839 RepID=A0ABW7Q7V3_9MICO
MSDPTQPKRDEDDETLADAVVDVVVGDQADEPVDEDLNPRRHRQRRRRRAGGPRGDEGRPRQFIMRC